VVQAYTNCEEAELFLNGESQGRKVRADFEDNVIKWLLPFAEGHLEIVGYNDGREADRYSLFTAGKTSSLTLTAERSAMEANHRDVNLVQLQLVDAQGYPVRHLDEEVTFSVEGPARIIGIDNGSEFNVEDAKADHVTTYCGRAFLFLQATGEKGRVSVRASTSTAQSELINIRIN
jgi:hypothetical protein